MRYKPKKTRTLTAEDCEQSVETLLEYRRKGIPLMPHQKEFLQSRGHNPN